MLVVSACTQPTPQTCKQPSSSPMLAVSATTRGTAKKDEPPTQPPHSPTAGRLLACCVRKNQRQPPQRAAPPLTPPPPLPPPLPHPTAAAASLQTQRIVGRQLLFLLLRCRRPSPERLVSAAKLRVCGRGCGGGGCRCSCSRGRRHPAHEQHRPAQRRRGGPSLHARLIRKLQRG